MQPKIGPGPPKVSIVELWAPQRAPKWSPKWSQSDNGRPSRKMRRRGRIACPPPLGSSIFTFCITFGSILGSMLESFWVPSSSLYSFLGAGVHKKGLQKEGSKNSSKKVMRVMVRWSGPGRARGGGIPTKIQRSDHRREKTLWTLHCVP